MKRITLVKQKILEWLMLPKVTVFIGEYFFRLSGRRKRRTIEFSKAKKVLVLRMDEFGDLVMMSAFWRELRRNMPQIWITAVVNPATFNFMEQCPYIDEVLIYTVPTYDVDIESRWACYRQALNFSRKMLFKNRYDLAIYPRWDFDFYHASFLAYFSGAPCRLAYSEEVISHKRESNKDYDHLFTELLCKRELKHEVERNLDIIRHMGYEIESDNLESWFSDEDNCYAESRFLSHGVKKEDIVIAVCPSGGNSRLKQWPIEKFIKLCKWLVASYKCRILLTGSVEEKCLGLQITDEIGEAAINMAGKTTLRQMAAMLKKCTIYIGNDAGTMHMASSLGLPVVALFGPTCPHRFGPWGQGHSLLQKPMPCNPCGHAEHRDRCAVCIMDRPYCIEDITIAEVQGTIKQVLSSKGLFNYRGEKST